MDTLRKIDTTTRDEWLTARRDVLTATDIARLYTGGPAEWDRVKAEKRGEHKNIISPYFDWGHEREPIMIDWARDHYDDTIAPNDCLYEVDRYGATPDGISADGKTLVECKTTGDPWDSSAVPARYRAQIEWQLMVMGADRCVLVWEERLGESPHFYPGIIEGTVIVPDEQLRAKLVAVATRFLADEDTPEEVFPPLIVEYAAAKGRRDEADAALKAVEDKIRAAAGGDDFTYSCPAGKVSLTCPKARRVFDQKKFSEKYPEMAEEFSVLRPASRPTLRVTLTKGEK